MIIDSKFTKGFDSAVVKFSKSVARNYESAIILRIQSLFCNADIKIMTLTNDYSKFVEIILISSILNEGILKRLFTSLPERVYNACRQIINKM
jgi:hypothetical protein